MSPEVGGKYQFRLTSLNVINPENRPDAFEQAALFALEKGETSKLTPYGEYVLREKNNGESRFRYFAPLYAEESCISCHGDQGYEVGDIRGGMSISFSTDAINAAKQNNVILMIIGGLITSALISVLIYSLMYKNVIEPVQQLEQAAEKIGKGDFETDIKVNSDDEIGDLARVLNQMQSEIRTTTNKQVEYEKMYALGQLSSGIAHEIRNPLFAVRNNIDYLERNYADSSDQQEVYQEIEDGLSRVSRIINSVLNFSRPHSLEFEQCSIQELVDRTMALLGKQLQNENVTVDIDIDPAMPRIEMDVHRMEQVLVNLITNAMKAMSPGGGKVTVRAGVINENLELSVIDTGAGMNESVMKHIFEPFFSRSSGGTGLGLTIVHRIIEQHNGNIKVESKEGVGSEFIVTLPITHSEVDHVQI
jgi:signal transduction histidine kinase